MAHRAVPRSRHGRTAAAVAGTTRFTRLIATGGAARTARVSGRCCVQRPVVSPSRRDGPALRHRLVKKMFDHDPN
jgi:hypothetical protein